MGRVAAGRAFRRKTFLRKHMMRRDDESLLDRSRPGSPTTASGVARQGTCENYAAEGISENKRRKANEKTAGNVERETHIYKG